MIQFFIFGIFSSCFFLKLFQIFALGTYGVTTSDILFILLFIYILYKHIWLNEPFYFVKNKIFVWVGLLLFCVILSSLNPIFSTNKEYIIQYFKTSLHFYYIVLFCSFFALIIIDLKIWKKFFRFMMICSILLNIFAVYQLFARIYELPGAWIKINNVSMLNRGEVDSIAEIEQLALNFENFYRATSIFSEPSSLAGYNLYVLIFLIVPFFIGKEPLFKSRSVNLLILIPTLIGTFLTFSLTATTGLLFILCVLVIVEKVNRKRLMNSILYIFLAMTLLIVFDNYIFKYTNVKVGDLFYQRIASTIFKSKEIEGIVGESFGTRSDSFYDAIEVWKYYPIFGIGLGDTYLNKVKGISFSIYSSMAVLIEMGLVGLIVYIGFFLSLLYNTFYLRNFKLKFNSQSGIEDYSTLAYICFYIIILQIFLNFVTSNIIISEASWLPIMFVVSIVNNIQIKNGYDAYELRILKYSLKDKFIYQMNSLKLNNSNS